MSFVREEELISYVMDTHSVREGRARWRKSNIWQGYEWGAKWISDPGNVELRPEEEGIVWARGWGSKEARALRTACALVIR